VLLVAAGALVIGVRARVGWDQDIWWHLRTGQWIVEHGRLPSTDPFTQFGSDTPLVAYSWLFDWIVFRLYGTFGLKGIVLGTAALGSAVAGGLFLLVRQLGADLLTAALLTVFAYFAMMPLTTPRPWLCSVLLLIVEMIVIAAVMDGATPWARRSVWTLPALFVIWANLHIQFVVGLVVLAAVVLDAIWYRFAAAAGTWPDRAAPGLATWVAVTAACVVATLATPNHVRLWLVARDLLAMPLQWTYIGDFIAPDFRQDPDWVRLALTLTAAACIGWRFNRDSVRVFLVVVFAIGVYLGFKARRDIWINAITAAAVIASARSSGKSASPVVVPAPVGLLIAGGALVVVLTCAGAARVIDEAALRANVARTYPDGAAAFIEQHVPAGALFNYFDWGGYLMWRLPRYQVNMDGRVLQHGEARILRHIATWQGRPAWQSDPELAAARIVVGPKDAPLASLLRLDRRFALVYEDRDGPAVVFEKR